VAQAIGLGFSAVLTAAVSRGMGGWDRSRSPRKQGKLQWISKQIALIGRYAQNRPPNLEVDHQGCLTLQNLMDTWGQDKGVSKEDIVAAVEQNLVNERTGGSRFKMHYDQRIGDTVIQVHRSGGEWPRDNGKTTTTWSTCTWNSGKNNGAKTWDDRSQVKQETNSWKSEQTSSWKWADNSYKNDNNNTYRENWTKEEPKTDWTQNRGNAAGWRLQGSQTSGSSSQGWQKHGKGHSQDMTEQIQRYMGFLLKGGKEDGVQADWDGYAYLSDMVTAMQNRKPEFNINDVESLKQFLQDTDHEGRFTVDEQDRVKKIDRNERHGNGEHWKGGKTNSTNSYATPAPERRPSQAQPAQFNAFKPTPAYATMHKKEEADYGDDDDDGQATPGVSDVKVKQDPDKPKKPPGKHWTQYDDNTTIWWYYEGPKGIWWMGPEHSEPQPYTSGEAGPGDDAA